MSAAQELGVPDTPTGGSSRGSVALRPPGGPPGSATQMPIAGSCGRPGGDERARLVVRGGQPGSDRLRTAAARAALRALIATFAVGVTVTAAIALTNQPHRYAHPMPACELDDRAEGHEKCPPPPKGHP